MALKSTVNDIKCLEHSTLKVPYEVLNKRFRTAQKMLDREGAHSTQVCYETAKLITLLKSTAVAAASSNSGEKRLKRSQPVEVMMDTTKETELVEEPGEALGDRDPEVMDDSSESNSNSLGTDRSESSDKDKKPVGPTKEDAHRFLDNLVERLVSLKRKASESVGEEIIAAHVVSKRVQHLKAISGRFGPPEGHGQQQGSSASSSNGKGFGTHGVNWKKTRLNRMLVDHLLREGMYDSAGLLACELGIEELTNIDVFLAAKEVEESLKRHETSRMVAWCYENKSKLRKIRSTLELEIRVQEFVEMVRHGKRMEAVRHARKYLADIEDPDHIKAVKKCMGLLAFPISASAIHPYYDLLFEERWNNLIRHFRSEHARIYQLCPASMLGTVVQAGLASLKTPACYKTSSKNPNCPVCADPLSALASILPYAHSAHSQLVCSISGDPLNEHNPPVVLPSGYVYGTTSMKEMARSNSGKVVCPRSGNTYILSEAERVFVM